MENRGPKIFYFGNHNQKSIFLDTNTELPVSETEEEELKRPWRNRNRLLCRWTSTDDSPVRKKIKRNKSLRFVFGKFIHLFALSRLFCNQFFLIKRHNIEVKAEVMNFIGQGQPELYLFGRMTLIQASALTVLHILYPQNSPVIISEKLSISLQFWIKSN